MRDEAYNFYDDLMTAVCELCHRPYVETDQEALDDYCEECCPVNKILKERIRLDTEKEANRSE